MKTRPVSEARVPIRVVLGDTTLSLGELATIGEGTIIELDRACGEPVPLFASGSLVAKGEVVVIDERFGIRVTELCR
jgi:flagellar motor switch protein FliN/FliY